MPKCPTTVTISPSKGGKAYARSTFSVKRATLAMAGLRLSPAAGVALRRDSQLKVKVKVEMRTGAHGKVHQVTKTATLAQ